LLLDRQSKERVRFLPEVLEHRGGRAVAHNCEETDLAADPVEPLREPAPRRFAALEGIGKIDDGDILRQGDAGPLKDGIHGGTSNAMTGDQAQMAPGSKIDGSRSRPGHRSSGAAW